MKANYFISYWGREYPVFSVFDKVRNKEIECSTTALKQRLFVDDEYRDEAAKCIDEQISFYVDPCQFSDFSIDELTEVVMEGLYG